MADGDDIAVTWVKTEIQKHNNLNKRAIDMTNAESPLASSIDDDDLGIAFNQALGKFESNVTGKPKEGNVDDEYCMIEMTMAFLYKEMGNIKRYNEIMAGPKEEFIKMKKRRHSGPAKGSKALQQTFSKQEQTKGMMPKMGDPTDYSSSSE